MVVVAAKHDIKWLSPSPIWDKFGDLSSQDSRRLFARPTILRFDKDNFMEELLAAMSYYPDRLIEWKVRPETWREPMPTPPTAARLSVVEPRSKFNQQQKRQIESNARAKPEFDSYKLQKEDQKLVMSETGLVKLYQPAQQRYYLISASLVCRERGLPDRVINTGSQEQARFVIRRLVPRDGETDLSQCIPSDCDEFAYVQSGNGFVWHNITTDNNYNADDLIPDEERLPMVAIGFDDLTKRKRRLVAGFIPVAKREAYLAAPMYKEMHAESNEQGEVGLQDTKREALKTLFEHQVAAPWKAMISQAISVKEGLENGLLENTPANPAEFSLATLNANNVIHESREQIQTISWYVLLDMADFLEQYIPNVWKAVFDPLLKESLSDDEQSLLTAMQSITISAEDYSTPSLFVTDTSPNPDQNYTISGLRQNTVYLNADIKSSLIDALVAVKGGKPFEAQKAEHIADLLENNDLAYERNAANAKTLWPAFLFPLADPLKADALPNIAIDTGITEEPEISEAKIDELTKRIVKAITDLTGQAPELATFEDADLSVKNAVFIIRCVYERPNCGPFNPPVVSKPSQVFEMASFFDSDAPGRPIRIPMPLDVSPAGLRKFNKNTTFMISDMLCGKIRNIRKISFGDLVLSVLPWPFHKDLPTPSKSGPCGKPGNTFGMFCSLSIPIVTLCALILLIIMVTLFDVFFRWLPLLFSCFKLPGLKGKSS